MLPTGLGSAALVAVDGTAALISLAGVVVLCTGLAAVIRWRAQLGNGRDEVVAAARATVQLAVVGLVITAVLGSWWLTAGFLTLMLSVAALTAARRVKVTPAALMYLPVGAAALPVTGVLLLSQVVPLEPVAVIPVAGILVGNAMTATTLCGRRALDALSNRHGEYEAALALGFLPRDAALEVARADAALALVPGLDQTRTVGVVTLPGAFVGSLLGGATPLEAAALQLVVLVALLLVQSVATLAMLELVVRDRLQQTSRPSS